VTIQHPARVPLLVIAGAFVVGAVALALAWSNMDTAARQAFWPEVGKAGLQAIVVAGVGAIVTAALKYMEEQREAAQKSQDADREDLQRRNDYRLGLVRRLRTTYSNIKRARRQLETAGFIPQAAGPLPEASSIIYRDALAALTEAKLDIEALREELEAGVGVPRSTRSIEPYLVNIERYLDAQAIEEYRGNSFALLNHSHTLTFADFPKLQVFVGDARATPDSFGPRLSVHYHVAVKARVADILARSAPSP
jgi:hypothetical protein